MLDGKVIAAMVRRSTSGDFRANLHQGGMAIETKISPEERKLAIRAACKLGLKFAGRGYFAVLERAAAARSQFLAGARRHREDHGRRYCRAGAGLHRAPHLPHQAAPEKGRLTLGSFPIAGEAVNDAVIRNRAFCGRGVANFPPEVQTSGHSP